MRIFFPLQNLYTGGKIRLTCIRSAPLGCLSKRFCPEQEAIIFPIIQKLKGNATLAGLSLATTGFIAKVKTDKRYMAGTSAGIILILLAISGMATLAVSRPQSAENPTSSEQPRVSFSGNDVAGIATDSADTSNTDGTTYTGTGTQKQAGASTPAQTNKPAATTTTTTTTTNNGTTSNTGGSTVSSTSTPAPATTVTPNPTPTPVVTPTPTGTPVPTPTPSGAPTIPPFPSIPVYPSIPGFTPPSFSPPSYSFPPLPTMPSQPSPSV